MNKNKIIHPYDVFKHHTMLTLEFMQLEQFKNYLEIEKIMGY